MSKAWKITFTVLAFIFTYHLVRDILQAFGIHNSVVDFLHRPHRWCRPICDYVTIPPELFVIVSSVIVLKRNKVGMLGAAVLISLLLWPVFILLP